MPVFACPRCGGKVRVAEDATGPVACPDCRTRFAARAGGGGSGDKGRQGTRPGGGSRTAASGPGGLGGPGAGPKPKRRPKARRVRGLPPWVRWAVIGGVCGTVVLGVVVLAVLIAVHKHAGPAPDGGLPGAGEAAEDVPVTASPPRPPRTPTPARLLADAPVPDAGAWQVTPYGVPLAQGLRTAFPIDLKMVYTVFFSGTEAAQASIIGKRSDDAKTM